MTISGKDQNRPNGLSPEVDRRQDMQCFTVRLSAAELAALNRQFPASRGSGDIGKRAVEIVKVHFRKRHPGCTFVTPPAGADLAIAIGTSLPLAFEVKGTSDTDMAWGQLKCSSKASHDLLASGAASVLRVTNVFGDEPVIFELKHGRDFRLEAEARWTFKRAH